MKLSRCTRVFFAVLALGSVALSTSQAAPAVSDSLQSRLEISSANTASAVAPPQSVDLVVSLKLRNQENLNRLLAEQSDPGSPMYHHYLTTAQFVARFGPTDGAVSKVLRRFWSHGLQLVSVAPNRLLIEFKGTAAQINALSGLNVTADLADVVQSVIFPSATIQLHSRMYYPQDIATAYNFPNSNNVNNPGRYSGRGVTIAIATAYTYLPSDVSTFWSKHDVHRTGHVINIPVGGITGQIDPETTLDLEMVGDQAQAANVLVYSGNNPEFMTFSLVYNKIVTDNKADVITTSWGACEQQSQPSQLQAQHQIFEEAAAQGMAVFAASGDNGVYDCNTQFGPDTSSKAADFPSSDPNVTAVGGTSMHLTDGGSWQTAWSGSGGGVSQIFPRPSWQRGVGFAKMRNTPDVALDADPKTGYHFYFQGQWINNGGTSFAAPSVAALWSLATEAAGGRLGPANPIIYRIANSPLYHVLFTDITRGDNSDGIGGGYTAKHGYDNATGWGTPKGGQLVDWLANDYAASQSRIAG